MWLPFMTSYNRLVFGIDRDKAIDELEQKEIKQMDLMIKSQEGTCIINADNIVISKNKKNEYKIITIKDGYRIVLGTYISRERAIQTLSEIEEYAKMGNDRYYQLPPRE